MSHKCPSWLKFLLLEDFTNSLLTSVFAADFDQQNNQVLTNYAGNPDHFTSINIEFFSKISGRLYILYFLGQSFMVLVSTYRTGLNFCRILIIKLYVFDSKASDWKIGFVFLTKQNFIHCCGSSTYTKNDFCQTNFYFFQENDFLSRFAKYLTLRYIEFHAR